MAEKKIKKILVVDDVKMIRMVLERELTSKDYIVKSVGSGKDAIKICNSNDKPDLVLLDLKLPDMSGLQVLRQIQVDSPDIAVVVVSAINDRDTINKVMASGAVDFMIKPINFDVLFELIRKLETGVPVRENSELKKIAIISSNGNVRLSLKQILGDMNFEMIFISNDDEFEEKFKFRKFDVIIIEWEFDNNSGVMYVKKLVETKKADLNKILFLIPNSLEQEEILNLGKNGIKNIILKPLIADNMLEKIKNVCG